MVRKRNVAGRIQGGGARRLRRGSLGRVRRDWAAWMEMPVRRGRRMAAMGVAAGMGRERWWILERVTLRLVSTCIACCVWLWLVGFCAQTETGRSKVVDPCFKAMAASQRSGHLRGDDG